MIVWPGPSCFLMWLMVCGLGRCRGMPIGRRNAKRRRRQTVMWCLPGEPVREPRACDCPVSLPWPNSCPGRQGPAACLGLCLWAPGPAQLSQSQPPACPCLSSGCSRPPPHLRWEAPCPTPGGSYSCDPAPALVPMSSSPLVPTSSTSGYRGPGYICHLTPWFIL